VKSSRWSGLASAQQAESVAHAGGAVRPSRCSARCSPSGAYQRAIDDTSNGRLMVACAFDCGSDNRSAIRAAVTHPAVTAVGANVIGRPRAGQQPTGYGSHSSMKMECARVAGAADGRGLRALDVPLRASFSRARRAARGMCAVGDTVTLTAVLSPRLTALAIYLIQGPRIHPRSAGWGVGSVGPLGTPRDQRRICAKPATGAF